MLYFAKTKLGYKDEEFWKLTLRKYIALRDIYNEEMYGQGESQEEEIFADDYM